jgi:hypothetical protein
MALAFRSENEEVLSKLAFPSSPSADRSTNMTGHSAAGHDERGLARFGLCLATLLVVLLPPPPISAQSASRFTEFPQNESPLPAPGGSLVLTNTDFDHPAPAHQLTIMSRATSRTVWTFDYGRHVLAGWSADGRSLAITDYGGSNFSRLLVVRIDQRDSPNVLDLSSEFEKSALATKELRRADHCYLEGLRWLASDRLIVHLRGYGSALPSEKNGPAFSHCYEYRIGDGFSLTSASSCNPAEGRDEGEADRRCRVLHAASGHLPLLLLAGLPLVCLVR